MSDFKAIYKILRTLDRHKGDRNFSNEMISAQALKLSYEEWEQIMIELQRSGLIRGIVYDQSMSDPFPRIVDPIRPVITLAGMEYLESNSMMSKARELLRMIGDLT